MTDDPKRKEDDTSPIIVPDMDISPEDGLADDIAFRDSPYHPGQRVAVATKRGVDVCWNCHRPVLTPDHYVDVPMREALMRMCKSETCLVSAARELMKQPKPFVQGGI